MAQNELSKGMKVNQKQQNNSKLSKIERTQ